MDKIKRVQDLVKELVVACKAYYVDDNPIMTDKQYDLLYDELLALEKETGYILSSSPTQKAQGEILPSLKKVKHTEPMLSADKSKDINNVIRFMDNQECVLSWKLDGLTLVLKYNGGKLQQAITRGGGDEGEDVTHTVKTFTNIPLIIDYKGYLEIRGEGLVTFKDFERINAELIAKGEEPYKSPRNLASGSVRQLNANITKSRNLMFIAFGIIKCDTEFTTKCHQFEFLSELGFDVVYYVLTNTEFLQHHISNFESRLKHLPYLTDGLIVEFDDIAYGKAQGSTGHHTKNMFALKWQDDSYETVFRGVELNTTRTGMVSLTALFDEVDIDGVNVSRASLHNYDIFESLELGIGDVITVYRANAVIPQVEENLTKSNTYKINMKCPSCGGDISIKRPKEARFLFCDNENCPAKLISRLTHFVSKNGMNIEGLSESTLEKFVDFGFIKDFADIYTLSQSKSKIVNLNGFGLKSYNKLIDAIEKSKDVELEHFLYSLGIGQLGLGGSKRLAKHFDYDINRIMKANRSGLILVEDFGEITADKVYSYFRNEDNIEILNKLLGFINIKKPEKKEVVNTNNIFTGKKVYATGTFANYKKDEIQNLLEGLGAEFASGYAKSLDYLIEGSLKSSSKVDKAKKDGIPVITEQEFVNIVGRG